MSSATRLLAGADDPVERPLRVAVLGTRGIPSAYSGLETVAEHLYAALAARGHQITVYCRRDHTDAPTDEYRGVRLVRTPALRGRATETLSHVATSLAHACLSRRFDVVHYHALAPCLLSGVTRKAGIPSVATVHGLDWQRAKWKGAGARLIRAAERAMVRHVDEVVVLSEELQGYYAARYGRATARIPNGVARTQPPAAPRLDLLAEHGLRPGRYLLSLGRLVPEKRVEDVIAAFRRLDGETRLAIVGAGTFAEGYHRTLRQAAAGDERIVFTGALHGDRLDAVARHAAAYVSASELEGMPCALLEAMERGVPVLVSEIPPHREVLSEVGTAPAFAVGDVPALHGAMRRLLDDPDARRADAARAQERVRARYCWDEVARQTESLYRALLARRAGVDPSRLRLRSAA
jgi:glycosyltransferase involved in cell wall biosynthesis